MRIRRWLSARTALYALIIGLWATVAWNVWHWADGTLGRTFAAVAELKAAEVGSDPRDLLRRRGARAAALPGPIAEDASRFGDLGDASTMRSGYLRAYGGALLYTLGLVLPVSLVLPILVYALAALAEEGENRLTRWRAIPERFIDLFDQLPYILWSLVAMSLALWLFRERPFGRLDEWVYQVLHQLTVLCGFGLFLFVFLFREQRDRLKTLRRSGIIDAERVTGIAAPRLYARLLRFRFRPLLLRQFLYLALFIMLLEFSFSIIHPFYQAGGTQSVFAHGGGLFKRAEEAHHDALQERPRTARTPLETLGDYVREANPPVSLAGDLLRYPELIMSPRHWSALRAALSQPPERDAPQARALAETAISGADRRALYLTTLRNVDVGLDALLLFSLFMLIFVAFDLPSLVEEREA